jgi:hypothetical protein
MTALVPEIMNTLSYIRAAREIRTRITVIGEYSTRLRPHGQRE